MMVEPTEDAEAGKLPPHEQPWPYGADRPQRYSMNRERYIARGGLVRLEEDVRGFVEGGRHHGDMARFYFFSLLLDQLYKEGIEGDIAELGVYRGDTATLLANIARKLDKRAFFLDTFEGFPAEDLKGVDAEIKMEFSDTSLEAVSHRIGSENVQFVQGYFPGTTIHLPEDGKYSLVHIDCDLYSPMMSGLEYFYPRMAPGGYIVMHDYSSLHWSGAEKAVDEFFADKPESPIGLPDSSGSAVIRRAKSTEPSQNWMVGRRAAAIGAGWIAGSSSQFATLQKAGWSDQELWGVWGVGDAHSLHLAIAPGYDGASVLLEAEGQVPLVGDRLEQTVDILWGGEVVGIWTFTAAENLGVRSVVLPALGSSTTMPLVEFRPRDVRPVSELGEGISDQRVLGLGILRLRLSYS